MLTCDGEIIVNGEICGRGALRVDGTIVRSVRPVPPAAVLNSANEAGE
jgi:hypothetical protein